MAWGNGGEELRERAKVELSHVRMPVYRLGQTAAALTHSEKGPRLRELVAELNRTMNLIEELLGR